MKQYFINTWEGLWTVLVGMKITFKHLFDPAVTIHYSDIKPTMPERARNRLFVNMDDCIGCDQCARACPVNCISIETLKSTPDDTPGETSQGKKKALWVTKFDIDIAKCCFCSLCVYPCPTECIEMTKVYEFSEFERNDLIYKFAVLTPEEITDKTKKYDEFQAAKEAEKLAAAKAKAEKAKQDAAKKADDNPDKKAE
ncbi:MAG: NADH-quinone oxidoreductase subunit I [Ignavibacteriae bacterium]|nr:NADH-quinone oxidoreductase subunit I [Ignavibacteriota bacterium]